MTGDGRDEAIVLLDVSSSPKTDVGKQGSVYTLIDGRVSLLATIK